MMTRAATERERLLECKYSAAVPLPLPLPSPLGNVDVEMTEAVDVEVEVDVKVGVFAEEVGDVKKVEGVSVGAG